MRSLFVAILSLAFLGAAKPTPTAPVTDARGWSVFERPEACLLSSSDAKLAFVAVDGRSVAIVSPGAIGGAKAFSVDSGRVEVQFRADGGLLLAPASDPLLVSLFQSRRIRADWPDLQIDVIPPEIGSLVELRSCGARISTKKADAQRKEEKRREFWQRLARAGAGMSAAGAAMSSADDNASGIGPSPLRATGSMCMKKREWTSGLNKNCVYDCLGSEAVETIGSAELCPLTINR
jgi:hypothetical protein